MYQGTSLWLWVVQGLVWIMVAAAIVGLALLLLVVIVVLAVLAVAAFLLWWAWLELRDWWRGRRR